jgi:hypothetical protein
MSFSDTVPQHRPRLESLPIEILDCIAAHIHSVPEIHKVENRAWFSVESLQPPKENPSGATTLKNLSRVSSAFTTVARAQLFKRIIIDQSRNGRIGARGNDKLDGFDRLDKIAGCPRISHLVQTFSYMVRRTYLPGK